MAKPESCDGKVRFNSFAIAETTARRQSKAKSSRIRPYHCHLCNHFHVGTARLMKSNVRRKEQHA